MSLLATPAQLALFLDADVDEERANQLLAVASGEVRACTGQWLSWVENDVVRLDGEGSDVLLLPEVPVAAVVSVIEGHGDGTVLDGPDDASPVWEWNTDGILRRLDGAHFARRFRWYRVVYDHGWDPIPDEIVGVVLRAAGRALENPEGIRQETLGRYSYTLAGEQAGVGLYGPERDTLALYSLNERRGHAGTAAAGSGS